MQSVAVANADRLEAFSNGTEHDTPLVLRLDDTSESDPEVQTRADSESPGQNVPTFEACAEPFNGKEMQDNPPKQVYSKPCPKSKKVNLQEDNGLNENNETTESGKEHSENGLVVEDEPEYIKHPDETGKNSEDLEGSYDIQEVSEQCDNKDTEPTKDDVYENEPTLDDKENDSEIQDDNHWEFQESTNEPPTSGLENGTAENEGIVTEPVDESWEDNLSMKCNSDEQEPCDLLDHELDNMHDAEQEAVTITAVNTENTGRNEKNSTVEDTNGSEAGFVEDSGETSAPLIEFPNDSPDSSPKVLHHCDNPIDTIIMNYQEDQPEHKEPLDVMEEGIQSKVGEPTHSFAHSLRSLSGRRAMKSLSGDRLSSKVEQDDAASASKTSQSSIFSFTFGKRKAENDDLPKKQASKRIKADEGVDSLGFFAKLTSPVVNRLRRLKVVTTGNNAPKDEDDRSSADGEEVFGHEEIPVTIIGSPPPSKWCSIM